MNTLPTSNLKPIISNEKFLTQPALKAHNTIYDLPLAPLIKGGWGDRCVALVDRNGIIAELSAPHPPNTLKEIAPEDIPQIVLTP